MHKQAEADNLGRDRYTFHLLTTVFRFCRNVGLALNAEIRAETPSLEDLLYCLVGFCTCSLWFAAH